MAKGKDAKEMVDEAADAAAPPKKKKKLLLIIVAVVGLLVLVGGGLVGYLLMSGGDAEEAKETPVEAAKDESPPVYEKLDTATVRLADMQSYLQVDITLRVADGEVQGKVKTYMPEVRNDLLRLLSSKTAEDLSAVGGQDQLAQEIQAQINQTLGAKDPSKGVKNVLFTSFIIQ